MDRVQIGDYLQDKQPDKTGKCKTERAWNIFDHIHTKRRNRLLNERVHKLAFVMINRSFRNKSNPIIAEEFDF